MRTRFGRPIRRAGVGFLAAAAVALTVLMVGLYRGPVWSSRLASLAAEQLADDLPGDVEIEIGFIGVAFDLPITPTLHLRDLVIESPTMRISVDEAETSLTTRGLGLLSAGHVLVEVRPRDDPPPDPLLLTRAALLALDKVMFRAAAIASVTVQVETAEFSRTIVANASATVGFDGDRLTLALVEGEGGAPTTLRVVADPRSLHATLEDIPFGALGRMFGADTLPYEGLLSADLAVNRGAGGVADASGWVAVRPAGAAAAFPPMRLDLVFDHATGTMVIGPSVLALQVGPATVAGRVQLADRQRIPFEVTVTGEGASGVISGVADPVGRSIAFDRIAGDLPSLSVEASAVLSQGPGGPVAALSASVPHVDLAGLAGVWPASVAPGAREWVFGHVEAVTIRDARLELGVDLARASAPGSRSVLTAISYRFEDAFLRPIEGGPLISGLDGLVTLGETSLSVEATGGMVTTRSGATVALRAGHFVVPQLGAEPEIGQFAADLAGPASAMLALARELPFGEALAGLDLGEGIAGEGEASIAVSLPLVNEPPAEAIGYSASIALRDLALDQPVDGRQVSNGEFQVAVANGVARITGTADLDGVPVQLDLVRPFAGGDGTTAVRMTLDDAARAALGFDLSTFLVGPVMVALEADAEDPGIQHAEVDLTAASLRFDPLGWEKPSGRAATASFTMAAGESGIAIADLAFDSGSASVAGAAVFDAAGGLIRADLSRLRLSEGDDLALSVQRGAQGGYSVDVSGERFDARGLIRLRLGGGIPGGAGSTAVLDVTIGEVIGFGEERLLAFNLSGTLAGGRLQELIFSAQTLGGGTTSGTVTPLNEVDRRVVVEAGELGRLVRFVDLYPRLQGGRGTLIGTLDASGALSADLDGQRLIIVDEPAMDRFASAAPDAGGLSGVTTAEILRSLVTLRYADGVLTLTDVVVRTAGAGLSLQGAIDFRAGTVDIAGTYLPASELDSLLGRIPLLGPTLFAGGRAGVLGVTFRVSGPVTDPMLSINPLSVIAPGIFRKLFELG